MREHLHTPWSDEIGLVEFDTAQDSEGYLLPAQPPMRTVFGTWEDGVSQAEFYSSMKAGLQANASVEIWTADMSRSASCSSGGAFTGSSGLSRARSTTPR